MKLCEDELKEMLHQPELAAWTDEHRQDCACRQYVRQLQMIRRAGSHWWEKHCEPDPQKVEECEKKVLERLRNK